MELTTIPEFFERRYSREARVVSGAICAFAGILNMGLFPKMGAVFLTYASGLGTNTENAELIVNAITTILILLVLVYTVSGGMVAIIVTANHYWLDAAGGAFALAAGFVFGGQLTRFENRLRFARMVRHAPPRDAGADQAEVRDDARTPQLTATTDADLTVRGSPTG
jgi:hypothetical protein